MYIPEKRKNRQITLFDFNQSCGMELDPDNEWIKLAHALPLCVVCLLWGCGSSDSSGNASITDDWKCVEVEVNGKRVTDETISFDNPLLLGRSSSFSCTDGTNFTLSVNGKSHSGTLTESEGVYTLNFDDSTKKMEAQISGNRMTINIVGSSSKFVFETK